MNTSAESESDALSRDVSNDPGSGKIAETSVQTDLHLAQEDLRWSEKRYRKIFDQSKDGIIVFDVQHHRILDLNNRMATMYAHTRDELLSRNITVIWNEHLSQIVAFEQAVVAGREVSDVNLDCELKNGKLIHVEVSASFIDLGGLPSILCVVRDDTERKQAEEKCHEQSEFLENVFEALTHPFHVIDVQDYSIIKSNFAVEGIDHNVRETCHAVTHKSSTPCDGSDHTCPISEVLRTKKSVQVEHVHYDQQGQVRIMEVHGYPIFNKDGEVIQMIEYALDITERKEAEVALWESEEDLRNLYANAMEGIFRITPDGKFLFANPAMAKMFGYDSVGDMLKTNAASLYVNAEQRVENTHLLEQYGHIKALELEMLRKDGSKVWVRISSTAVKDKDGITKWHEGFISNISESKKFEQEVLRAQKLESVGQLAGGLAHDFNNTLMTIQLNAATASLEENVPPKVIKTLKAIEASITKATGITRQLLSFAKGGEPVKKTTDLRILIRESVGFALAGTNISPNFDIDNDLYLSDIDRGQIDQVINNLVINARQAMPKGGELKISARNISVTPVNRLGPLKIGVYTRVSIRDQGHGIDACYLDKIFDPYFTRKDQGSGLGLFSCYSIMDKHDGWITAESEIGIGSDLIFYLPVSHKALKKNTDREIVRGTGNILIMDDEPGLRGALSELLNAIGYTTSTAADGEEAIRIYTDAQKAGVPFDVVILDLTIPNGLGGEATAKRLKLIDPNVKTIVSSGYTNESIMANFESHGFNAVLDKPYKLEELAAVVKDTIEQA